MESSAPRGYYRGLVLVVGCSDLVELYVVAQKIGVNPVEMLSVSLLVKEGLGRVAISKKLGLSERTVRNILHALKASRATEVVLGVLHRLQRRLLHAPWLTCSPVLYSGVGSDVTRVLLTHVVSARDYIVVYSGDPDKVEVVGVVESGRLEYPGIPQEIVGPYMELGNLVATSSGVLVCWRNYVEHVDDAVLLVSLARLCAVSAV